MKYLEQNEMLEVMTKYNTMSRKVIKENLFHIRDSKNLKRKDIVDKLGYETEKIAGWFNRGNDTIPLFEDALKVAIMCDVSITDLVREDYFGYYDDKKLNKNKN